MGGTNDNFAKTICSICYEDLKPIVEDLQAISICGHVFHELCLQQWFEYCSNSKKQTCPVCKQGCTARNVGRLYFQSVGDPILSQSQIPTVGFDDGERPELLRREVKRLENKVSGLVSALDHHQNDVKHLTNELQICKDQLSKEVVLKNEALRQKECIQSMLHTKSSDLVKSTLECSRLQERNLELAKEIAALKLVSDCNMEEEEIVKLASLGNESNRQDTIDVLKKSLFIRNKSYKELMAKCNSLGRGEARSLRKLEKAKEKMIKLKSRVQELETALEAKDNELLRYLKDSKKRHIDVSSPSVDISRDVSPASKRTSTERRVECPPFVVDLDEDGIDNSFDVKETNYKAASVDKSKCDKRTIQPKKTEHFGCLTDDEDELQKSVTVSTFLKAFHSDKSSYQELGSSKRVDFDNWEATFQQDLSGCASHVANDHSLMKDVRGLLPQDIKQVQPSHTNAEGSSSILVAEPGDRCFAGGLLGPNGANMYLGKWCKRAQNKATMGSTNGSANDSLIAVGPDGRGGRIKVLRSISQTTLDTKESTLSVKRYKSAPKSSSMQSQGCLQIEHFFGKARN